MRRASVLDVVVWSVIFMALFVGSLDVRDWWLHQ